MRMKIEEPLDQGRIHLKHRIVFPPMATRSCMRGLPVKSTVMHYQSVATNPLVGLVITEHSYISMQGRANESQMSFASDDVIETQKALTDAVHEIGPEAKLFAQINHAGANTSSDVTREPLVSASGIDTDSGKTHALTKEEIHGIEQEFAEAAHRVKEAGYDGVEIHCAHGYLLNQFYSPLTNHRTDEYGPQSVENRIRFTAETVRAVREAVGDEYPVAVRLGGCDYIDGGSTIIDAAEASPLLEEAGADLIDLSGGLCGYTRRDNRKPGWFSDMSTVVRLSVSVPVMLTGGITKPREAETLLGGGHADLIGIGRALYRDAAWGTKAGQM